MKMTGEPDAGNPQVRFDEGMQETCVRVARLRPTLRSLHLESKSPFRIGSSRYRAPRKPGCATLLGRLRWKFVRLILRDHIAAVADRHATVQMFVNDYGLSCQRVTPPSLLQLENAVGERDGIVVSHRPLMLCAEDPVQILAPNPYEGSALLSRWDRELPIELGNILVPKKVVGCGQVRDAAKSQFLRQPTLPGSKIPLRPAARLRRIRRDHFHPQFLQRASHLGRTTGIDSFASFQHDKEMARPVTVQRAEQPFRLDHFA